MKLVLRDILDAEHVPVAIAGAADPAALAESIIPWAVAWERERRAAIACPCAVFGLEAFPPKVKRGRVEFALGWLCDRCIPFLAERIDRDLGPVGTITIGSARPREPKRWEPRPIEWVDVPETEVEFEDGRRERVPPFQVTRWPISVAQYEAFVTATGYRTEAEIENGGDSFRDNQAIDACTAQEKSDAPACCVAFTDADAYCRWAGAALPTESQWLAAAVLDWAKIYDQVEARSAYTRLTKLERALRFSIREWTATVRHERGKRYVTRASPTILLTSRWRERRDGIARDADHRDLMLGFRCVRSDEIESRNP